MGMDMDRPLHTVFKNTILSQLLRTFEVLVFKLNPSLRPDACITVRLLWFSQGIML